MLLVYLYYYVYIYVQMERINNNGCNDRQRCDGEAKCGFAAVTGMVGFWPLDLQDKGKNLVADGQDFTLTDVEYQDDDGRWKSAPAYFPSRDSRGVLSSSSFSFGKQESFSWMAAFKQESNHNTGWAFSDVIEFDNFVMKYFSVFMVVASLKSLLPLMCGILWPLLRPMSRYLSM